MPFFGSLIVLIRSQNRLAMEFTTSIYDEKISRLLNGTSTYAAVRVCTLANWEMDLSLRMPSIRF